MPGSHSRIDPLSPGSRPLIPFQELTLRFINELRAAGLRISIAESMDAMEAIGAVGLEQDLLREALAASLVKEEDDRFTFDEIFARFFAGPRGHRKGKLQTSSGEGERQQTKTQGDLGRPQERPPEQSRKAKDQVRERFEQQSNNNKDQETENKASTPNSQLRAPTPDSQPLLPVSRFPNSQPPAPKNKALLEKPFHLFDVRDVEGTKALVEALARQLRGRLHRRYKPRKHGRLDFRRTIRASISHGGAPIDVRLRDRRPGKPDLVVFCDLSGSVATVSDFLLALIAPASSYFRRVRTFAYVDRLCEVSFEHGHVVPHTELDLYARSDFGKVLQQFWRDDSEQLLTRQTLLLVLGDARNNRRPPRPDLLVRIRDSTKKLVWLNPEPPARWNTGDSVMKLYEPACDMVLACGNLRELFIALKQAF